MTFFPAIDAIDLSADIPMVPVGSASYIEEATPIHSEVKGIPADFIEKVNREFKKLVDENPARVSIHHLQCRLRGSVLNEGLTDLAVYFVEEKRFDEAYETLEEIKKSKARLACINKMIVEEVLQDDYFAILKTIGLIKDEAKKGKTYHLAARCYLSEKTAGNIAKATVFCEKIQSERLRISLMKQLVDAESKIHEPKAPQAKSHDEFDLEGAVNFINACETRKAKGQVASEIFKALIKQNNMKAAYALVDRFSAIKDDCLMVLGACLVEANELAETEKVISLMTDDSPKKKDLIELLHSQKCMNALLKNDFEMCVSYLLLLDEYLLDTLKNIFKTLVKKGKLDQTYSIIDKLEPEDQPFALLELGLILVELGNVQDAMSVLDKIPEDTPDRDTLVLQIQEAFD